MGFNLCVESTLVRDDFFIYELAYLQDEAVNVFGVFEIHSPVSLVEFSVFLVLQGERVLT